ncbi:MAG: hypothetical protein HY706_05645 [Candidatus Hydrogenedentes bacterium]|nr:hypothetical protein [Candidatus Hydrogenedentota bacterium]
MMTRHIAGITKPKMASTGSTTDWVGVKEFAIAILTAVDALLTRKAENPNS